MKPISDARTRKDGCTYLRGRMHVLAGKVASTSVEDAVHCKDGCSALQRRLQCTASSTLVLATFPASTCIRPCKYVRLR